MSDNRKKGSGYEEVRKYIVDRIKRREYSADQFVRITGGEIADAVGLATQTVNFHVRELLRRGVVIRNRRVYYALPENESSLSADSQESQSLPLDPNTPSVDPKQELSASVSLTGQSLISEIWNEPRISRESVENEPGVETNHDPKAKIESTISRESAESKPGVETNHHPKAEIESTISRESVENFVSVEMVTAFIPDSVENEPRMSRELKNCSNIKYQEKEKEIKKEKCVDFLGDYVDSECEDYLKAHQLATKLFNRFGAGVRKGTSPVLINRFVAGLLLRIPLINFPELEEQLRLAEQETAKYESFKGFGKQTGIRRPFIRIANYLKKCYEAAGWTWTACSSPFEFRLKKAHARKTSEETTPIFPSIEKEIKASMPTPGTKSIFAAPEKPFQERELTAEEMRLASQYPSLFGDIKGTDGQE